MSADTKKLSIQAGQTFDGAKAAEDYLKAYCAQEKQLFRKRTSDTIQLKVFKPGTSRETHRILYKCKYGDDVRLRGKGERQTKTCRLGCTAFIMTHQNMQTQKVVIKKCHLDHSTHPLTTAFFHLSKEVRLDFTEKQKSLITSYLEVDGNRRLIQKKLMEENKFVKLKDLTNRKQLLKNQGNSNLQNVVDYLINEKKAKVQLRHDDDGNEIIGLFFQTEEMKRNFSKFPEILSMDGTYKLLAISLTFVLFLVVDGEGCSTIVGAGLLAGEDVENFEWLLNCLKEGNPNASGVKSIMSDKCPKERAALNKVFPGIPLYICRFHTMQIFERTLKYKIKTQKERDAVKLILEKMIYCSSEERYMSLYQEYRATAPEPAIKYFDDNWHPIRNLWCDYGMTRFNLGNLTNNRLESINQKLKAMMKKNNSLMDFFLKFFIWEESHMLQNDFRMSVTYTTQPVSSLSRLQDSPAELYRNLLTSEGFQLIEENFEKCEYLTFRSINEEEKHCMLRSKSLIFKTELEKCGCPFWSRMELPCHHIFGVRLHFGQPLYDENLCHRRWKREYSTENHRLFPEPSDTPQPNALPTLSITRRKSKANPVITVPEKRRSIKKITDKILEHTSLLCGDKYTSRKKLLQKFYELLKKGIDFDVVEKDLPGDDALADALAELSFDNSSTVQQDDLHDLKMPSPVRYRGRPSQMTVTTPTPRKSRVKKHAK